MPIFPHSDHAFRAMKDLYFDGALSNTEYILKHCVMEDTAYMADYVTDREGKVREIRYDKISGK